MISRYLNRTCSSQNVVCLRSVTDVPVEDGLAMTPAQMNEMMQRGLPIASANLGLQYEEGVSDLNFEPPLEHRRGVDLGDMFEARQAIRKRASKLLAEHRADLTPKPVE